VQPFIERSPLTIPLSARIHRLTQGMNGALWALLLVSIPVTSFPLLSSLTGYSTVSPLAAIPALLLIFSFLIPYMIRDGKLERVVIPLAIFVLAALISSLQAPFLDIPPFKEHSLLAREARALATLGTGILFYMLAALIPRNEKQLERSLRWIHIGVPPALFLQPATSEIERVPPFVLHPRYVPRPDHWVCL